MNFFRRSSDDNVIGIGQEEHVFDASQSGQTERFIVHLLVLIDTLCYVFFQSIQRDFSHG